MWRVNGEAVVFCGASAAALLQIAHPGVAAAIDQHSDVSAHPLKRFRGTFTVVYRMVFGTWGQAEDAARRLRAIHDRIEGVDERGVPYLANDRAALRWVYATLIHTAALMYERIAEPLSPELRTRYLEESKRFAYLFGLESADLPADWPAFERYFEETAASLEVSRAARRMVPFLLRGERPGRANLPLPRWYSALSAATLPPPLRERFGIELTEREARRVAGVERRLARIYPRLPETVRRVPPYHEARYRLAGRVSPPLPVRLANRAWFGVPTLVSSV